MISGRIIGILVAIGLLLGLLYLKESHGDQDYAAAQIQSNLDQQVALQETDLANFLEQLKIYTNPFDISTDKGFSKRVYVDGRLIYWSDSDVVPDYLALRQQADSLSFLTINSGVFLVSKKSIKEGSAYVEVFSFYPLYTTPQITNEYIGSRFDPSVFGSYVVRLGQGWSVRLENGQRLEISILNVPTPLQDGLILVLLIYLLCMGYVVVAQRIHLLEKPFIQILYVVLARAFLFSITSIYYDVFFFDPRLYSAGWLNFTLGDLSLNVMSAGLILFIFLRGSFSGLNKYLLAGILMSLLLLSGWSYFSAIWSILDHSQIEFDIQSSLDLTQARAFVALLLVVLSAILFWVYQRVVTLIMGLEIPKVTLFVIMAVLTASVSWAVPYEARLAILILMAGFWLTFALRLRFLVNTLSYKSLVFSILAFTIISTMYSSTIYYHQKKDVLISKEKYSTRLLIKNDILGELYLSQAMAAIQQDAYIRSRFYNRILNRQNIKEKIKNQFLSSYFDKYDIKTYLFDSQGAPMGEHDSLSVFEEKYKHPDHQAGYEGVFLVSHEREFLRNQYISFVPIESLGTPIGTIVIDMNLKKYIPYSVFPRLLIQNQNFVHNDNAFDYAVYYQGQLMYKFGKYEFENRLTYEDLINPDLFDQGIEKDNMHLYGIKTSNGSELVLVSPAFPILGLVANFSVLSLLLFFSFSLFFISYSFIQKRSISTLSYKIQVYLGLSFVVPMMVVSIATLNTLNESNKDEIDTIFLSKTYGVQGYITQLMEAFSRNEINKDEFVNRINLAAELVQSDINVYSPTGSLLATSAPEIFNLGLLGHQLDPRAYNAIRYGNREHALVKQNMGQLVYRSSFWGIRSNGDGQLIGVFSMPYFESRNHLETQQQEIFSNLVSIFTLILILAILGGNLIISRLISPLKLITRRLQSTNLEDTNKPIDYTSSDEVGALVKEYNAMIVNLEASKAALAESQKASAWQEIARQVAHEIKNPLTPMRLKIQQLLRTKSSEDADYRVLSSLIPQIDTLSSIADSFSAFAKMPVPKNEQIDINALIAETCELYRGERVDLHHTAEDEPCLVYMDPKIVSQILNNLLLNGIQAAEPEMAKIEVNVTRKEKSVLVSVQDHGCGIPKARQEDVFKPYFSTKSSGSGIGLSVAKKGIENAGGTIWFESEEGEGTSFFISIPLMA